MKPQKPKEDRSHPYLILKKPPDSLEELRRLINLPSNIDIYQEAIKGANFEECIGTIAAKLDIALDGDYEPDLLFTMLCEALRNRGQFKSQPHLRAAGLVNAELVERDGDVTLERRTEDGPYIENSSGDTIDQDTKSDTSRTDETGTGDKNDDT